MERLEEKSGKDEVNRLIKKLEVQIIEGKVSDKQLENLQTKLDKLDEELEDPDYKLYELQAIIHYANNNKTKSLEFIEDALSLEPDPKKYSRTGALLAEIYFEKEGELSNSENIEQEVIEERVDISEEPEEDIPDEKELKNLRKIYSGNFEGWLAVYTLRAVLAPIVFIFGTITSFNDYVTYDFEGDVKFYLICSIIANAALAIAFIALCYSYFKKQYRTIEWARSIEALTACLFAIFILWTSRLFSTYGVADDGTIGKNIGYTVVAIIWTLYWFKSKRIRATFINK